MNKDTFQLWLLIMKEQLAKNVVKHFPKVILRQCFLYCVGDVIAKSKKSFNEVTVNDILSELEQ